MTTAKTSNFSLVLGKDKPDALEINYPLAKQQLANIEAMGENAGLEIAQKLGKSVCDKAAINARSPSDTIGNAVESILDHIHFADDDSDINLATKGFSIESTGSGYVIKIPRPGTLPGASAIENNEELHNKFTDALFASLLKNLSEYCRKAWDEKSTRPSNVYPLSKRK